ncbi:DUF2931 family protein [Pseudomonas cerasi]
MSQLNGATVPRQVDFIVVGGGSAGSVMAARLSEEGKYSVLVIEAGGDSDAHMPHSPLRDASRLVLDEYNWHYQVNVHGPSRYEGQLAPQQLPAALSRRKPFAYRLGKVMGGSSAVNGAVALRPFPSDFQRWVALGCTDWSWEQVLPWFNRLENDADRGQRHEHGSDGPLKLLRPREVLPLEQGFADACQKRGILLTDDLNVGEGEAVGAVPANVIAGAERYDLYRSYLAPVRHRENLSVITDVTVERVLFSGSAAVGGAGYKTTYQYVDGAESSDVSVGRWNAHLGVTQSYYNKGKALPLMLRFCWDSVIDKKSYETQILFKQGTWAQMTTPYTDKRWDETYYRSTMIIGLAPEGKVSVWLDNLGDPVVPQSDAKITTVSGEKMKMCRGVTKHPDGYVYYGYTPDFIKGKTYPYGNW